MLKIKIIAVGKIKEKYFSDAIAEYSKRLSRYCSFEIVEVKEETFRETNDGIKARILKAEEERILRVASGYKIAFAIEGKKNSSEGFAERIGKFVKDGENEVDFIIGGSYGLSAAVKAECKESVSFSDMTFPHTLMRVVAAEQIYRAFTILSGSEYHK